MKVVLLCAGYSTRLYPITLNQPKCLLPVGKKRMLDHIMDKLHPIKADEYILISNNKFHDLFVNWARGHSKNFTIVNNGTNSKDERLGAVGDLHKAVKDLQLDDDLLVIGTDNLFEFNVQKLHDFFNQKSGSVVAVCDLKDPAKLAKKFGTIEHDDDHKIVGFEEKPDKPKTSLASTCCYLFSREGLKHLPEFIATKNPDNSGDFIRYLMEHDSVYAWPFKEEWADIGTHDDYKAACEKYSK